jgi:hypothetical protein
VKFAQDVPDHPMVRRELSFSVEKFLGTRSVESAKGCKGDRKRVWVAKNFAAL